MADPVLPAVQGGRPATAIPAGGRLRLARLAAGLSQEQLAARAEVSRQAVAGIEAGRFDPSLRVALELSRALGHSVEDLFAPPAALRAEPALLVGAPTATGPSEGMRVDLAELGGRTVAFALFGDESLRPGFVSGLGEVTGLGEAGASGARGRSPARPVLVEAGPPSQPAVAVAGCDPALGLLAGALAALSPPRRLVWWPCNSAVALELAAAGLVHAAGVHLPEGSGQPAGRPGAPAFEHGAEVLGFGAWQEGLALRPGPGPAPLGLEAIAERQLRLVNREEGSEARQLLDAELARIGAAATDLAGYRSEVRAHLLVASAVASGLGDAGVTMEPAARAYGLDFAPLARETFQLVVPRPMLETPEVRALLQVLSGPGLRLELARLPGYDATTCGEPISSL